MKPAVCSIRENTINLLVVFLILTIGFGCGCPNLNNHNGNRHLSEDNSNNQPQSAKKSTKANTKAPLVKKSEKPDNGDFLVEYIDVQDEQYEKVNQEMRQEKVLERAAKELNKSLALPYDITLVTRDCGQINAFYSQDEHSVTMCYEIMDFYYQLFRKSGLSEQEASQKMFDTMQFIFLHELGHALIDAYQLPVTGNEEDSADRLSSYINLKELGDSGSRAAIAAANAFSLQSELQDNKHLPFYDEHSLDQQRFYNILCALYGSNPDKYEILVTKNLLPEQRAARCPNEYQQIVRTWEGLLKPYRKQ